MTLDLDSLRREAMKLAQAQGTSWVGVALQKKAPTPSDSGPGTFWWVAPFTTKQAMLDWFASEVLNLSTLYEYIAIYDKTDPRWESDGAPIAEQRSRSRTTRASGLITNARGEYGDPRHRLDLSRARFR